MSSRQPCGRRGSRDGAINLPASAPGGLHSPPSAGFPLPPCVPPRTRSFIIAMGGRRPGVDHVAAWPQVKPSAHGSLPARFHRREPKPQEWRELAQGHFVVQGPAWVEATDAAFPRHCVVPTHLPTLLHVRPPPPVASTRLCSWEFGSASSAPAVLRERMLDSGEATGPVA